MQNSLVRVTKRSKGDEEDDIKRSPVDFDNMARNFSSGLVIQTIHDGR